MTTSVSFSPLACLEPIALDELNSVAALQTRVDRKYLLTADQAERLLAKLESDTRVLTIDGLTSFAYMSVYFDTPDLTSYLLAAQKRRRRFKIRTRTYLDSAMCWLEVKTRGSRGSTVKNRTPYDLDAQENISPGRDFVAMALESSAVEHHPDMTFSPVIVTRYRRTTLFLPQTSSRVTVDTELEWENDRGHLRLPELVILETKSGSVASDVDRMLWCHGHRPARVSKYATGLAALHSELPSNRWRRTLSRYFDPESGIYQRSDDQLEIRSAARSGTLGAVSYDLAY